MTLIGLRKIGIHFLTALIMIVNFASKRSKAFNIKRSRLASKVFLLLLLIATLIILFLFSNGTVGFDDIYIRVYVRVLNGVDRDSKFNKSKCKTSTFTKLRESLTNEKLVYKSKCPKCRSPIQLERPETTDPQTSRLLYSIYLMSSSDASNERKKLNYSIDLEEMVYNSVFSCDMNNVLRQG
jgi:hypothetical protein